MNITAFGNEIFIQRFLLIGGVPFRHHMNRGTTTFNSLKVIGGSDNLDRIKTLYQDNYEEYAGLLLVVDVLKGEEVALD